MSCFVKEPDACCSLRSKRKSTISLWALHSGLTIRAVDLSSAMDRYRGGRFSPEREILTGAGKLVVRQPRVRDKSPDAGDRVTFSPNVLPPYLKRTESIEELIPWLYLKGISTGDFSEALQALVGDAAKGLSANVVVRLKEQWSHDYEEWSQRDLSSKDPTQCPSRNAEGR
jgi:transposase-like protein